LRVADGRRCSVQNVQPTLRNCTLILRI